jgi:hypothetical protein
MLVNQFISKIETVILHPFIHFSSLCHLIGTNCENFTEIENGGDFILKPSDHRRDFFFLCFSFCLED